MRRPTKRSAILVLVAGLLVLAGSTAQAGWLFVLAAGVTGLLGASFITPQGLRGLSVERSGPSTVVVGDQVQIRLTLDNGSKRSTPALRLEDQHPGLDSAAFFVESTPAESSASTTSQRLAAKRGVFHDGSIRVISGAPFGFVAAKRTLDVPSDLTVLPTWVELRNFPLRDAGAAIHEQRREVARVGSGSEFVGLRPYRHGDPRRHVHWRSSARRGSLVVREHEEEVMGPVVIAMAGTDVGEAPDSAFEMMVSAAASIALYAQGMGHPLELIAPSPDGNFKRSSRPSRSGALAWFAGIEPVDSDMSPLVSETFGRSGRGSTIVLVAPSTGAAGTSLREATNLATRIGARPLCVMADVSGWDETLSSDMKPSAARTFILERGGDLRTCLHA